MAPLAALFLPWITLDGSAKVRTGVTCVALLVSPIRDYLFSVDPIQAALVTLGPIALALLSIVTSNHYYRRRAVIWAPPVMLAVALAMIYLTPDLVSYVHDGLRLVTLVAILLFLHQVAIQVQVATRRNRRLSWASGPLAIATGIEQHRSRR